MTGSSSTTSSMTGTTTKTSSDKLSGVNNCLKCITITDDKYDDVIKHLRDSFFVDEPLNSAVGLCKRGETHEELEKYCRLTLSQKFSCMVIDENGQVFNFFFFFFLINIIYFILYGIVFWYSIFMKPLTVIFY